MTHAFLILSSYGIDYLIKVLEQFPEKDNLYFYIHLNGNSFSQLNDYTYNEICNAHSNIRYCGHHVNSERFTFDACHAINFLFETAFNDEVYIDYYHLISESCYIIVPFNKFEKFFENAEHKSFIWCYKQDIDNYYAIINNVKQPIYYGYDWFSLHNDLLSILFNEYGQCIYKYQHAFMQNNIKYYGSLPENIFATIICHDIFKDDESEMNKHIVFDSLRYQNYYDYNKLGNHARTLTLSEFTNENNEFNYDKDKIINNTLILRKIDYKNPDSIALVNYLKHNNYINKQASKLNIYEIPKYILTMPTNEERMANVKHIKENIFPDINIRYAINSVWDEYAYENIQKLPWIETNTWDDLIPHFHNKISEYSCSYEHYRIIKEAYLLGYDNVLVLEDDVIFEDIDLINEFLEHAPEEFDMLKLSYWNGDIKTFNEMPINPNLYKNEKIYWIESNKMQRYGTIANLYSRSGMKKYLDYQDKNVGLADVWTYELNDDKKYIASIPIINGTTFESMIKYK